jgi:hypothetical protein
MIWRRLDFDRRIDQRRSVDYMLGIWPYDRRWLKGIGATFCAAAALGLLRSWMGALA